MPTEYLPHDQELLRGVSLIINQFTGNLNVFVQPNSQQGTLFETAIEFQFMPKITSDGRKGSWDESEVLGREPISNVATVGPRIMSMSWTYIVDEIGSPAVASPFNFSDTTWTIARIKRNINALRGYFLTAKSKSDVGSHRGLVARLRWPLVAGIGEWSCRITDVSVKHSENLVGNSEIMFPVKSDVTIDIRLWTRGTQDSAGQESVQNVRNMKPMPGFGDLWY